ncbi:MAG: hypothetical protein ACPHID_02905 [Thermoplasmatota archaeon]
MGLEIEWTEDITLVMPDGGRYLIQRGRQNKGISLLPVEDQETYGKGRPPNPSTVRLRERIARDAEAGQLEEPKVYWEWLVQHDPRITVSSAKQITYRELRPFRSDKPSRRGARLLPSTAALRALMEKHHGKGGLKTAGHYTKWLSDRDPGRSETAISQTVQREMRRFG